MAQFRCGILPLRVETGRFVGLKLDQRTCQLCDLNEVEDEIHFITKCPIYSKQREILYNKVTTDQNFPNLNSKEKFIYILTHHNFLLANFLITSWRIRSALLYENTKS